MRKEKLLGAVNIEFTHDTFMPGTQCITQGYKEVYAVEESGEIFTKLVYVDNGKVTETGDFKDINPFQESLQFVENNEWKEV